MSHTISLWGCYEASIEAETPMGDPFHNASLTARVEAPDGSEREVEGFWDGGDTWRVRFAADQEGPWQVELALSTGQGASVGFECAGRSQDTPFFQHGPVRVDDAREHFIHADGTPFLWMGDTAWNGPLRSTREEWAWYLAQRKRQGFTAVQWVTTQWRAAPDGDREGHRAWTGDPAHIEIHPEHFQRLDDYARDLAAAGLLSAPVLLWSLAGRHPEQTPGHILPEDQAAKLARYMVARWQGFPSVWILPGDGRYEGENAEKWRRIGRAVFGDRGHAPAAFHCCGKHFPADTFREEPWLDVMGYQSGHGDTDQVIEWIAKGPPATDWSKQPRQFQINLEPAYENHRAYQTKQPHSAHSVRRAVYASLFNAPTAGVTYGGHGVWGWDDGTTDPVDHPNSGVPLPWREAIMMPGAKQMRHVVTLLESIDWWRLRPAPQLLAQQPGDDDIRRFQSAAASPERDLVVVYLPFGGALRLSGPLAGGMRAQWVDPRQGTWIDTQFHEEAGGVTRFDAPDDTQDWICVCTPSPHT